MEQQTGSKQGKEYIKAVYRHPAYLTYIEYIMQNARLDEAQAEIKIAWRNINNLRYTDDTTLMAESEEELKSLSMKVKEESENENWLKTQRSGGGPKMLEEQDWETTFSPTNSSKERLNAEKIPQNNF